MDHMFIYLIEATNIEIFLNQLSDRGISLGGEQIGDETWIGIHASIIGPVKIGKHCVIGANSVVTHDIPDYSVVVGNPGKIVKKCDCEKKLWSIVRG